MGTGDRGVDPRRRGHRRLTCSRLAERRGRHGTLLLIGVVFVVGSVAASLSQIEDHLAKGRFKPADFASR